MNEAAYLVIWLIGLFALVIVVSVCVVKLIVHDSTAYDEKFLWMRRLPPDAADDGKNRGGH
ncbi:hypothetical protein [Paenibacillus humicola]|uniref:hypothetical protein n=1 Tax=Paenibacillus humicola TaxID=3110540 RepID=UPI00237AE663|nr:hypothetical protein [Paenibacillus humicola]